MDYNNVCQHFIIEKNVDNVVCGSSLLCSLLQLRSCAYDPKYRIGAFGTLPLLMGNRVRLEDYGVVGVRYGSENLSVGASFVPIPCIDLSTTEIPLSFSLYLLVVRLPRLAWD